MYIIRLLISFLCIWRHTAKIEKKNYSIWSSFKSYNCFKMKLDFLISNFTQQNQCKYWIIVIYELQVSKQYILSCFYFYLFFILLLGISILLYHSYQLKHLCSTNVTAKYNMFRGEKIFYNTVLRACGSFFYFYFLDIWLFITY